MHKAQEQVAEFHRAFDIVAPDRPSLLNKSAVVLRGNLMYEELDELYASLLGNDWVGVVDGLADLLYVVYGTAVAVGIDIEEAFDIVHQANMRKIVDSDVQRRLDGKVTKPVGWRPPNIGQWLWERYGLKVG